MLKHNNNLKKLISVSLGGLNNSQLILTCAKSWQKIKEKSLLEDYKMIIFAPLFMTDSEFNHLKKEINIINPKIEFKAFTTDFIDYLSNSSLSISQAGYNTCMNILEINIPNILIPNLKMSDQLLRSQRLSQLKLTTYLNPENLNHKLLIKTILHSISQEIIQHNINLDGAKLTAKITNRL